MLLRHRTVALLRLARSEPRGSVFLNRNATGSLIHISYQMPIPMGAPSSELTGWLRRYSWSSRRSSTLQEPSKLTNSADDPELAGKEVQARLVEHAQHLAEEHVDAAGALLHHRVEPENARQRQQQGSAEKRAHKDGRAAIRS